MERPYHIAVPEPRWPWFKTEQRVLFTLALISGFISGSSALSFGLVAVLALINALALLLAYELAIRDLPSGWIAAGIFTLIAVSLGAYGAWLVFWLPVLAG